MNKSFWVLTNSPCTSEKALYSTSYINNKYNPKEITGFMYPKYHTPLTFIFPTKEDAQSFSKYQVHKRYMYECGPKTITFQQEYMYKPKNDTVDYFPIKLIDIDDDSLNNLFIKQMVVTTMLHFFVVEEVIQSHKFLTLQGFVLDPTPEIDDEHIELCMQLLEYNFLRSESI